METMKSIYEDDKEYNLVERVYISSKLSKVKWSPDGNSFVSGSYDDVRNGIELWNFPRGPSKTSSPKSRNFIKSSEVTDIHFIDRERFLFSTVTGELRLVEIKEDDLTVVKKWDKSQFIGDTIPSFDINDEKVVAVVTGDGAIALFSLVNEDLPSLSVMKAKDSIETVVFLTNCEVAQSNLRGQIAVWDLRKDTTDPVISFPYNRDYSVGVTSIKPFPARRHMLVAGGMDGSLTAWDLRNVLDTQTVYEAHSKPVSSLVFHPTRPSNLFTTSLSGEIWHWNNFSNLLPDNGELFAAQKEPDVKCLVGSKKFATNYCDVVDDRLVSCTDNDCLVFVQPLQLK